MGKAQILDATSVAQGTVDFIPLLSQICPIFVPILSHVGAKGHLPLPSPTATPSPQGEGLGADCVCKISITFPFGEGGTANAVTEEGIRRFHFCPHRNRAAVSGGSGKAADCKPWGRTDTEPKGAVSKCELQENSPRQKLEKVVKIQFLSDFHDFFVRLIF